jgi:hypothetical protein
LNGRNGELIDNVEGVHVQLNRITCAQTPPPHHYLVSIKWNLIINWYLSTHTISRTECYPPTTDNGRRFFSGFTFSFQSHKEEELSDQGLHTKGLKKEEAGLWEGSTML